MGFTQNLSPMKLLLLNDLLKTNDLLEKLKQLNPKRTLSVEAYSCKQTKFQKSYIKVPKPFRFFISALEMSFPDYDFSKENICSFKEVDLNILKKELSYVLFTIYKNYEEVSELINALELVFAECIDLLKSNFYVLKSTVEDEEKEFNVFIIYHKKGKRVLVLKLIEEY